jgi:cytochrome c oxidase subunit IV
MSGHSSTKSPLPGYFAVWIALLIGTGLTVYAATLDLAPFNAAIALAIATVKATLVVLFFMHVYHASEKLTKLVVISAIFFLLLMLGLTITDYATRSWS